MLNTQGRSTEQIKLEKEKWMIQKKAEIKDEYEKQGKQLSDQIKEKEMEFEKQAQNELLELIKMDARLDPKVSQKSRKTDYSIVRQGVSLANHSFVDRIRNVVKNKRSSYPKEAIPDIEHMCKDLEQKSLYNVMGDGNCGFYSLFVALYDSLRDKNSIVHKNFFSNARNYNDLEMMVRDKFTGVKPEFAENMTRFKKLLICSDGNIHNFAAENQRLIIKCLKAFFLQTCWESPYWVYLIVKDLESYTGNNKSNDDNRDFRKEFRDVAIAMHFNQLFASKSYHGPEWATSIMFHAFSQFLHFDICLICPTNIQTAVVYCVCDKYDVLPFTTGMDKYLKRKLKGIPCYFIYNQESAHYMGIR